MAGFNLDEIERRWEQGYAVDEHGGWARVRGQPDPREDVRALIAVVRALRDNPLHVVHLNRAEPTGTTELSRTIRAQMDSDIASAVVGPALAAQARPAEEHRCDRCDGCGRIADGDSGEPWTAWESLPPGSDLAVRMGLVKPIDCPKCGGTGKG